MGHQIKQLPGRFTKMKLPIFALFCCLAAVAHAQNSTIISFNGDTLGLRGDDAAGTNAGNIGGTGTNTDLCGTGAAAFPRAARAMATATGNVVLGNNDRMDFIMLTYLPGANPDFNQTMGEFVGEAQGCNPSGSCYNNQTAYVIPAGDGTIQVAGHPFGGGDPIIQCIDITVAGTTLPPTTGAPTTVAPAGNTTMAPTTMAPNNGTTMAPNNGTTTTAAPTTAGPTTMMPSTAMPMTSMAPNGTQNGSSSDASSYTVTATTTLAVAAGVAVLVY